MKADGGNLDDDSIERDWYKLVVITSIPVDSSSEETAKSDLLSVVK